MTSLVRVLEEFGSTLLEVVCGDLPQREIGGVVIHDPLDEPELSADALVLGVGLHEDLARFVTRLGERGALGLVVRAPVAPDADLLAAAEKSGVTVLAFARGASWSHLAGMLRALTADGDPYGAASQARSGDLFAVANAIAALLDAPVTVEDRNSRLLAFSSRQDEADPSRVQTILSRQVPVHYTRILEERGVFQAIYRSDRPVFVAPLPESGELPRAAIAVRAGDEILGTIWVVVPEPLDEERSGLLYEAAKLVALHLVWQRADADKERRLRAELLGAALGSGPESREAARRLGLRDEPAIVMALTVAPAAAETPAQIGAERKRLADAFAMHLTAAHPRSVSGLIGDVAFGVLPLAREGAEERATLIAHEFLARVGSRLRPLIGVGRLARDGSALTRSRSSAEQALRVLRAGVLDQQVALLDEVHIEALLLELSDLIPQADLPSGPVARIAAYDREHQANLMETLRAWLDAFGDVALASTAMFVHPNTFRYRLRRAAKVGGIDLGDPDARLSAMIQLRLMSVRSAGRNS
ncbi:PucR family transcriptional regulator [Actinomadura harenae]|uniref:PucR family transcriptional regulator n=1 Tax=Actinomadura harenae TaxID=2483351 RepID=A0A3M2MF85_9ACTN|nr:helix-turn-helix domain-containing protein [Actinomadura harenae]RMI47295.1 PucR family transcriptional regulator [Actinomadura harenae]